MKLIRCSSYAFVLLAFCARLSLAQSVMPPDRPDELAVTEAGTLFTVSAPVDEVRLNFTVTNKAGKFIKALTADDFHLLDNENPPDRVISFQAHANSPLRVFMLFDISSSIRYRFGFEQKAANHFLKHVLRPGIDQAAIISFGSDVHEVQPMTADINLLTSAVSSLQPGGDTALHDAVIHASSELSSQPSDTRKIIINLV
jgi:Ca-activated chloride channel family protein